MQICNVFLTPAIQFEKHIDGEGWLTEKGMEFPTAIRKYFHQTVCNFYDDENELPADFQESLRKFVIETGSHITTLNYDDLLYDCFTETPVFGNYHLRDGFFGNSGFDFDQAQRKYDSTKKEGWFLHLHGSPLFINTKRGPKKIKRSEFEKNIGTESRHLVLTNVRFKESTINGSEILSAYWNKLREIICDVEEIILFGYGGADSHLNVQVSLTSILYNIPVLVIEINLGVPQTDRLSYWQDALSFTASTNDYVDVQLMDNILEFTNWNKKSSITFSKNNNYP